MYSDKSAGYGAEAVEVDMPNHDGVGQALYATRNTLDAMDELVTGIENRLHGPRPMNTVAGNTASGQVAPEPGVLRLASDIAARVDRLQGRLAKINATL